MISKNDIHHSLTCNLLDCGYLDLEFFINLVDKIENKQFIINGEKKFLFYVTQEGKVIDMIFESLEGISQKKDINTLIYEAYVLIMDRINELYGLDLEEGEDYEIFTNCLDSHLSLLDDFTEDLNDDEQEIKEEISKIIEEFN